MKLETILLVAGFQFYFFVFFFSGTLRGDEFHYRSVLIGERAAGLGGAYTAISDDPTAVIYNPAGLAFSFENYISVSANSFSTTQTRYESIVNDQDYLYKSQRLIPGFLGFSQTIAKQRIGFAIIVPHSELIDQEDTISDISKVASNVNSFQRRFFVQDTTYYFGPSYSKAITERLAFGISFLLAYRSSITIDNQTVLYNPIPGGKYFFQNTYIRRSAFGFAPRIGFQMMVTDHLSLGLVGSKVITFTGKNSARVVRTKVTTTGAAPPIPTGSYDSDYEVFEIKGKSRLAGSATLDLGAAYFVSKKLLFSGDFTIYGDDNLYQFAIAPGWNASVGSEMYLSDNMVLRVGGFTNRANTPPVSPVFYDQMPHINLLGTSLSFSFVKPGSSVSLGVTYSSGTGEGQGIGSTTAIQKTKQSDLTFYLGSSYQL